MIGQLALVIYMWLEKDKYLVLMGDVVEKAWERRTRRADYMDAIQISVSWWLKCETPFRFILIDLNAFLQMECCGRSGFTDYTFQGFFPPSCCRDTNNCRVETVNRRGCKQAFVEYWDRNSDIIKYTGLVIAAIEVSFEELTSYQHELIPLTDCFSLSFSLWASYLPAVWRTAFETTDAERTTRFGGFTHSSVLDLVALLILIETESTKYVAQLFKTYLLHYESTAMHILL